MRCEVTCGNMAHGAPDHRLVIDLVELVKLINKIGEITKVVEITDLKNIDSVDLVDRITRIDAIDSLGEVAIGKVIPLISPPLLLFDDFESGTLKWSSTGGGTACLTNVRAFSGDGSVHLHGVITGDRKGEMTREFSVTPDLTMRASVRFSLSSTGMAYFHLALGRHTPTTFYVAWVRYNVAGKKWQYREDEITWTDILGGAQDLKLDPDTWHLIQLEVNFSTGKFSSLKVGPLSIDMSTIDMWKTTDTYTEYATVVISAESDGTDPTDAYVDDAFVEVW